MEREAQLAQTSRMFGGSPTARRTAAMADLNQPGPDLLTPAFHAVTGNVPAAGMHLAQQAVAPFVNMLTAPSERVNETLGNLLFNPAYNKTLMQNLTPGQLVSLRARLMGWQGQQAAALAANRNRLMQGTQAP